MKSFIHRRKTLYRALIFIVVYLNTLLTFAILYILLDLLDLGKVHDHYASVSHQEQSLDIVTRSLYFSAITLLSVGYGDVTPFGISRAVAIVEALIGYLLPVVIVIQFLPPFQNTEGENFPYD
ncbi:potassium channel family protein [Fredinandcohnia sp. QZ13]|uniref:potassium channel family protein n=1 Tax=Fredinandcohnia sp. QZ13 TaxID=3073144 RepID=UPI0028535B87|nr:potassium channel family protein [Fredinandcohnia sp. QZ13]MDR4887258.1 potassium channel family protein [Fredinandcohnia sp. QZ13]